MKRKLFVSILVVFAFVMLFASCKSHQVPCPAYRNSIGVIEQFIRI